MDYKKLAAESRKLYEAFCSELFATNEAYELTKVCLREFPIFRDMITEEVEVETESKPNKFIGYILFDDGTAEHVLEVVYLDAFTIDYYTEKFRYRRTQWLRDSFLGPKTHVSYARMHLESGVSEVVNNIKDIGLVKGD